MLEELQKYLKDSCFDLFFEKDNEDNLKLTLFGCIFLTLLSFEVLKTLGNDKSTMEV